MKREKRTFKDMSYCEVQQANSANRSKLNREDQAWLKTHQYRNVGWNQVISLYEKIEDFLEKSRLESWTLEDLYLEADRIGNKYLSCEEISETQQKLAEKLSEIADLINEQFPDTENEAIDFSKTSRF